MPKRTIVILANSIKHHQHCVAGKCVASKEWIRPVSDENGGALSPDQAKCENPYGQFNVKPKQKVEIGIRHHAPLPNQPDNYLVEDVKWQQRYKIEDNELKAYPDTPNDLWGHGDRLLFAAIQSGQIKIEQSLYLIQADSLRLYVNSFDKRRAEFTYKGNNYDLSVTDPNFDNICAEEKETNGILCVSLGEEYQGYCFKIVATIF